MKIKDICEKASSNVAQKELGSHNGEYPIYGASGFIKNVDFYHHDKPYVGVIKDGSGVGRVNIYPAYSSLLGTLQYILPKDGFEIRFISYALQSLNLAKYSVGAAIPHIYFRDYGEHEIAVPDISEQHRIVGILDAAFEKIDALKANAEKNLNNAKALFLQVLAKELEPKQGWETKKLGDVVTASNGLWKGKKPPFVNIAVIRNTNFSKDCQLRLDNVEYIDVEERQFVSRKLDCGDIIIEKSGGSDKQPVGRPILFDLKTEDNYSYSNFTSRLRVVDSEMVDAPYLHKALYNLYLQGATFALQSHTTGIHNLDFKSYLELLVPIPSLSDQQRIVATLGALFAKCHQLEEVAQKTIAECDALKQSILRQAFNGEL